MKADIASLFYRLGAMSSAQETELKAVSKGFDMSNVELSAALDACAMASGQSGLDENEDEGMAMLYAMQVNDTFMLALARLPEETHNVVGCALAGVTSKYGITEAEYNLLTGPFIKVFGKFGV